MKLFKINSLRFRFIATIVLYSFIIQILLPLFTSLNNVYAQSGPSQAETSGFSLGSTSGMVDKFTGDFNYSIPLMDVEGYPISISYNQNVSMDSEASWVGLGWDLSLGSMSRNMRGLPDDFNGDDLIGRTFKVQDNETYKAWKAGKTLSGGVGLENSVGVGAGLTGLLGTYKNTYNGKGRTLDFNIGGSFSYGDELNAGINIGVGYNLDSQNGIGRSFSIGLSGGAKGENGLSGGISPSYTGNFNSRSGKNSRVLGLSPYMGFTEDTQKKFVKATYGLSLSSVQSLGSLTTIPRAEFSFYSSANSFRGEVAIFSISTVGGISAKAEKSDIGIDYDLKRSLTSYNSFQSAFGYFHFGKRKDVNSSDHKPVMDYNIGGSPEISERSKKLPFAVPTYDMFSFSASGAGGQFRAQRHDVGTLRGSTVISTASGSANTVIAGAGVVATNAVPTGGIGIKAGASSSTQNGEQTSGEWLLYGNENFEFLGSSKKEFDNPIFFKSIGETTPTDMVAFNKFGGDNIVARNPIDAVDGVVSLDNQLSIFGFGSNSMSVNSINVNLVSESNSDEANKVNIKATEYLMKTANDRVSESNSSLFYTIEKNTPYYTSKDPSQRISQDVKKGHHLSSTEVITPSGMRYIYDIPVYNIKSDEVSFSATGLKNNNNLYETEGLVEYTDGLDNSVLNNRGKTQMFDKSSLPGYAHSFLLTEVLTPDYIDIDNNGPSANDIGNYYKFNYSEIYGESNPYSWRKPFSGKSGSNAPKAYFNDNFKATEQDDMANYIYGEKEVYLVHSLESKNMVAEFIISPRKDAYGQDENGFILTNKEGYQLDAIKLYNKNERRNNPNATPLKTVTFEYSYALCKNFPLNINTGTGNVLESGKLTLDKIRFKNRNSEEYSLAPYEFYYGTEGHDYLLNGEDPHNRDYSTLNIDRWGNYKENNPSRPNTEFPYADQNLINANNSANNWKLNKIRTPQNGFISIDYEADEYSFVQDKRVMNHYTTLGMVSPLKLSLLMKSNYSSTAPSGLSPNLRTTDSEFTNLLSEVSNHSFLSPEGNIARIFGEFGNKKNKKKVSHELANNVLIFELDHPYSFDASNGETKADAENNFRNDYLKDNEGNLLDEVFCKTKVIIDPDETDKAEIIPTFAKISKSIHVRYNMIISSMDPTRFEHINSSGLLGIGTNFKYGYIVLESEGVKDALYDKDGNLKYSKSDYNVNPIQRAAWEFSRVHLPEIVYADCDGNNCDYGLNSLDVKTIFGGDINKSMNEESFCLRTDPTKSSIRMFKQDKRKYTSNARVKEITYHDNWFEMTDNGIDNEEESTYTWNYQYNDPTNSNYHGVAAYEPQIGKDVSPFYQWTRYSNIVKSFPDLNMYTPEPFAELLYPAPVVGYNEVSIQFQNPNLNNNSGKSVTQFYTSKDFPTIAKSNNIKSAESKNNGVLNNAKAIALTQGYYVQTNDFHGKQKVNEIFDSHGLLQSKTKYTYENLSNFLITLDREAKTSYETVATEYDVYAYSSFSKSISYSSSTGGSLYLGFMPVLPVPIPFYVNFSPDLMAVSSENGIYINTFNKIVNRSAVVKSIETEYLGSHNNAKNIAYDRFSGNVIVSSLKDEYNDILYSMNYPAHWRYDNFRNYKRNSSFNFNLTANTFSDYDNSFTEGDIVIVKSNNNEYEAQVLIKENTTAYLINLDGSIFNSTSGTVNIVLKKTMRKNLLNLTMQSITTKDGSFLTNPNNNDEYNPKDNIISNSAMTFEESGVLACGLNLEGYDGEINIGDVVNPYKYGLKGIYRRANGFALQAGRTNFDNNLGTRFDGTITGYKPFYDLNSSGDWMNITEVGHPDFPSSTVPPDFDYYQDYRKLGDLKKMDEYGKILETVNQIDVKSSVLYGYNKDLKLMPVATASNAQQNEIAYDGFEDYNYFPSTNSNYNLKEAHFNFDMESTQLTYKERHSGLKSLVVPVESAVTQIKNIKSVVDLDECDESFDPTTGAYSIEDCQCTSDFSPSIGSYIVSAWVKVKDGALKTTYSNDASITIAKDTWSQNTVIRPTGEIIDGWQKIEGTFNVNQTYNDIIVSLNNDGTNEVYFDDFRIHPFQAEMTTVVYDPQTLLPMATHDAYNFTTFYNYDENYDLVSIKVETINGIKTISASEKGFVKYFKNN